MSRAVWQVSAGSVAQSYVDVLHKHGVALVSQGDAGPWVKAPAGAGAINQAYCNALLSGRSEDRPHDHRLPAR